MSLVFDCMYTVGHAQANGCKIPRKTRSKTRWCFCRGIKCSRKSKMNFRVLELKWVKWICDRKFDFYIISSDRDVNDANRNGCCSYVIVHRCLKIGVDEKTRMLQHGSSAANPMPLTRSWPVMITLARRSIFAPVPEGLLRTPDLHCPSINRPKTNRVGQLMTTAEIIAPGQ